VHLFVQLALQPHAAHALIVWCVAVGAVRCQVRLIDDNLG
jgi:hypothetical protein